MLVSTASTPGAARAGGVPAGGKRLWCAVAPGSQAGKRRRVPGAPLALCLLCLLCTACFARLSAQGPLFQAVDSPDPQKTLVYIYRQNSSENLGVDPEVWVHGQSFGLLKNNGYIVTQVVPGMIPVELRRGSSGGWPYKPLGVNISAEPGRSYYVRLRTALQVLVPTPIIGFRSSKAEISVIDQEAAVPEIAKTRALQDGHLR